jgi:hypothetical protein
VATKLLAARGATTRYRNNVAPVAAPANIVTIDASLVLPPTEAGQWELEVTIKQGKETASIPGQVSAAAPTPFLLSYWQSLSLPPIVIAVFALNQWLRRRALV